MAEAAIAAFAKKIDRMLDLAHADMNFVHTQTKRRNHKQLLQWAEHMCQHEARTEPHKRVYLVASDLRLVVTSQRSSSNSKWQKSRCRQRGDTFLKEKDVRTLHEKHWAVEINGRYYELVRSPYGSRFSSTIPVHRCDRQITARIFIGTTHCEHDALEEIGKAVIATQTKYELTRDNCHRFVRVYTAFTLCPNHPRDTLSSLPFGVEELIATRCLNQKDGCRGYVASPFDMNIFESDLHHASRQVGEGAEWTLRREAFGSELSLIIRRLEQKTRRDDGNTIYLNEFTVLQEQTSYFLVHDASLFSQCEPLTRSPYLSVVRFDRSTKYSIIPKGWWSNRHNYKPDGYASGIITGPNGVTLSNGSFKPLRPAELIRDYWGVWRDGSGIRLLQPKSAFFAELHDFFFQISRGEFRYRLPTSKLLRLAVDKPATKIRENPFVVLGIFGLSVAAYPRVKRSIRARSRARPRSRSCDTYAESSTGSPSPSRDRRHIQSS